MLGRGPACRRSTGGRGHRGPGRVAVVPRVRGTFRELCQGRTRRVDEDSAFEGAGYVSLTTEVCMSKLECQACGLAWRLHVPVFREGLFRTRPSCPAARAHSVPGVSSSVSWSQTSTPQGTPGHTAQCPDPDTGSSSSAQAFVLATLPRGPAAPQGQPCAAEVLAAVSPHRLARLHGICVSSAQSPPRLRSVPFCGCHVCACLITVPRALSSYYNQSVPWPSKTRHGPTSASHFMQGTVRPRVEWATVEGARALGSPSWLVSALAGHHHFHTQPAGSCGSRP